MIAFLSGLLVARGASSALVEVDGVGFRLLMSTASLAALPSDGSEVRVLTHLHVREDELTLYGFATEAERDAFEALLGVSGVGPKVALSVLSVLSPDELALAISTRDAAAISSVPGIGSKTAQRIIVDLAGRLAATGHTEGGTSSPPTGAAATEAREALLAMGFSAAEVSKAVSAARGDTTEELVRAALMKLGGTG